MDGLYTMQAIDHYVPSVYMCLDIRAFILVSTST